MDIKAKSFDINLSYDELWTIAFAIRRSIYNSLETHWINHQNSWKEHEHHKLYIVRNMFMNLGHIEFYEEIENHARCVFDAFDCSNLKE